MIMGVGRVAVTVGMVVGVIRVVIMGVGIVAMTGTVPG